jgi:ankyrin repeat protein
LEKGTAVNQATTDDGTTPLFMAAQKGHVEVVRLLLEKGAAVNQATTDDKSPLYAAIKGRYVEVVRLLLENGAEVNQATPAHGITPLLLAADYGPVVIVQLLLEKGAAPNQTAPDIEDEFNQIDIECTPLLTAAQYGHMDAVQLIAVFGAIISSGTTTWAGSNAALNGHAAIVQWLRDVATWVRCALFGRNLHSSHY